MTDPDPTDSAEGRTRRFVLAAGFAYLAVQGWLRLHQAVLSWDLLVELGAWPGPLYQAMTGAAWGLLGAASAILVYVRTRWARMAAFAGALTFALVYWLDFLLFTRAAEMMRNWPFSLALTLLGLLFTAWVAYTALGIRRE